MELLIRPTAEHAARLAVRLVADCLRAKPDLVLGCATGRTMQRIYAELVREHRDKELTFAGCRTFIVMANISKSDLAKELADATGMNQKDTKALVEGFLERITNYLKAGDKVQLTGFGTFEVRERSARTGVNPGTSERIEIPASKYPAFKAGKSLKDQVN